MKHKYIFFIIAVMIIIGSIFSFYYFNYYNVDDKYNSKFSYNYPIVPNGFNKVDTANAKWIEQNGEIKDWNKGLVIEDEIGNQFVWVPIDLNTIHYDEEKVKYNYAYNTNKLDSNIMEENQILKYGGFYVARYEAGVPEELQNILNNIDETTNNIVSQPVSQAGIKPWNYISYSNALNSAEKMYSENNTVKSQLITIKQIEAIGYWLNQSGYNVENPAEWGNYSNVNFKFTGLYSDDHGRSYKYGEEKSKENDNIILATGITDRNMANNIYDIVGNLCEYIFQNNSSAFGGYYDNISLYSYSSILPSYTPNSQTGFRVVLYIE